MSPEQEIVDAPARRRIATGKLLLALFCLVLFLLAGVYAAWQYQSAARVDDQLAALKAAGEPVSPAEMGYYYRIPDGRENCAALYIAACQPLEGAIFMTAAGSLPICGTNVVPPPLPPQPWPDQAAAEAFLASYQTSLDQLHEAARRGGAARYPINFDEGIGMLLPHVQGLRQGGRMLQLEALVRGHRGDAHGAAESIRAMWRTGESLEYEPIFVSQLVRIAIDSMAVGQVQDLLPVVDFSDDDLRMLQAEFRRFDPQTLLGRATRGERVLGLHAIEHFMGDDLTSKPTVVGRLFIHSERAFYLEYLGKVVEAADGPLPQSRLAMQGTDADLAEAARAPSLMRIGKMATLMLAPALGAISDAAYRAKARATTADAALAAELFRRRHGRWPGKLDELVPDFLPEVPIDPFDGQPLRIAVVGGQLILYSVGPDLVDDGGVETERSGKPDVIFTLTDKESAAPE